MLSKNTINVLVDLIENKLAMMQIGDREELREVLTLQRCLAELQGSAVAGGANDKSFCDMPQRGRRRKLADLIDEASGELDQRRTA